MQLLTTMRSQLREIKLLEHLRCVIIWGGGTCCMHVRLKGEEEVSLAV